VGANVPERRDIPIPFSEEAQFLTQHLDPYRLPAHLAGLEGGIPEIAESISRDQFPAVKVGSFRC